MMNLKSGTSKSFRQLNEPLSFAASNSPETEATHCSETNDNDKISNLSNCLNDNLSVACHATNIPTEGGEKLTSQLNIDANQVKKQLELLGYKLGEAIYLRAFFHKDDPRRFNDPGRKSKAKTLKELIDIVHKWQIQSRGVYFVVNGGGDNDKSVKTCRAIFYEHDDLDKVVQIELWKLLGLPEPTFQVDSGGKSIHSYWVFEEFVSPELWKPLQADLLEFADGDRSIKNPSRVMRLAGGWHLSQKGAFQSQIISSSGKKYSFDELRAIVKPQQKEVRASKSVSSSLMTLDVPLIQYLRKIDRIFIEGGASEGIRNTTGAMLARNLIGTAKRLSELGEAFSGDPRHLFDDYCNRCSPTIDALEAEGIWTSASLSNPTPTLSDDALRNCGAAWRRNNSTTGSVSNRAESRKNLLPDKVIPIIRELPDTNALAQEIRLILGSGICGSQLEIALLAVHQKYPSVASPAFKNLVLTISKELETESDRSLVIEEIDLLQELSTRDFDLSKFLHPSLAGPIYQLAQHMEVDAAALLTLLLPTAASLLKPGSQVAINSTFKEPLIFYTGVVAESGSRKSSMIKAMTSPLVEYQRLEDDRYQQAMQRFETDCSRWQKGDEKPHKPNPPREYFVNDITVEALDAIKVNQPDSGLLFRKDELSGLFSSYGAYKGGKGSDKESFLSGWSGGGIKKNRVGGQRISLSVDSASIGGTIQPDRLRKIMGDMQDSQGEWARFLWYLQPTRAQYLPEDDFRVNISGLLDFIYRKLDQLPMIEMVIDRDTYLVFREWHKSVEDRKIAEPRQGLRSAIAKIPGQAARLAGILHLLWSAALGVEPTAVIPIERVDSAMELAEFYLGQVYLFHSEAAANQNSLSSLSSVLSKLMTVAKAKGQLTARDAIRGCLQRKAKTSQVLEYFKELETMGYGRVEFGFKKSITFIPSTNPSVIKNRSVIKGDDRCDDRWINSETIDNTEKNGSKKQLSSLSSLFVDPLNDSSNSMASDFLDKKWDSDRPDDRSGSLTFEEQKTRMDNTVDDNDDSCPENPAVKGFAPVITPVITHDDSLKNDDRCDDSEQIKVGDRVRHVEPTHVRNGDIGTIEGQRDFNGDWIVRWDKDGDNQKHVSHRSYPLAEFWSLD